MDLRTGLQRAGSAGIMVAVCLMAVHGAGLEFETTDKEVHAGHDQRVVVVDYVFRNTGNSEVAIERYDATCSCMSVSVKGGKLRYAPGEGGVVRANFDMGNFTGDTVKSVRVWLEGDPADKPSVVLSATIHIPELVKLAPKTLTWEIGEEAKPQVIDIRMNHDEPIQLVSVTCGNEQFTTALETVEAGMHYRLSVSPKTTDTAALAVISIQTDCKIPRHAIQRAFAVVRRPVSAAGP